MRVLFATAELAPVARVGGLAEAAGGLVRALRAAGVEVEVVLPDYKGPEGTPLKDERVELLDVPSWAGPASARRGHLEGFGELTLVDVPGIRRPHPYVVPETGHGWADNDKRFIGFSVACAAIARRRPADVVHVNDWHTAATLAFLDPAQRTVLSLHNLAYQGWCDGGWLLVFGDLAGAYERFGACNPLVGAIRLADKIVAVSPTYASEIVHEEHGFGVHDLLAARGGDLVGILNGIDADEWNPVTDPFLPANYGVVDFGVADPGTKVRCRESLRNEAMLPPPDASSGPLIGMVTRLVQQKGVDLAIGMVPYLESVDAQLLIVGAGDPALAGALRRLSADEPDRVAFIEAYDAALAHRVFGGADLYLMPSRFEPCGLGQMQAMTYGTIPVVTDVGGLHDTVIDDDAHPGEGRGFVARRVDEAGVVDALHRAARGWSNKRRRMGMIRRGMRVDWSWRDPAERHIALYHSALSGIPRPI